MVETIEGKAVGETTPQKVHTSKKQKGDPSNVSAGSSEERRQDQSKHVDIIVVDWALLRQLDRF
jgi:hypothetical protein